MAARSHQQVPGARNAHADEPLGHPRCAHEGVPRRSGENDNIRKNLWDAQTRIASRDSLILVHQPAKPIALHYKQIVLVGAIVIRRWTVRRREIQASMRPMAVVMINVDGQDTCKVAGTQNEQPIEALGTDRPNESFCDGVRLRRLNRRANETNAGALEYVVEATREFVIAIPNQPTNRFVALGESQATCRACCVTHSWLGWAVQPAKCTRRLPTSMKNNTYNRWSQMVSTVKKSTAMRLLACA